MNESIKSALAAIIGMPLMGLSVGFAFGLAIKVFKLVSGL